MYKSKHITWIDFIRVIAIILVVLCHSTEEGIYDLTLGQVGEMAYDKRIFPFVCFTLGRLGVPLFLLITGYLLLGKEYNAESMKRHWKNNWLHIILCTMIWFFIYDIFLVFIQGEKMTVWDIIQDTIFLNKVKMSHVWYMPMIIGIYALIPFVANSLHMIDHELNKQRIIWIPLVFFLICLFFYPMVSIYCRIIDPEIRPISNQIYAGFSGGIYGIYLLFGWIIKKGTFKKIRSGWLILVLFISISVAVWIQLWAYKHNVQYNIWYDNPLLLFTAVCIFELLSRHHINMKSRFIYWLSSYSFAIYLIHFPIKQLLSGFVMNISSSKEIQVLIMWGLLLVTSVFIAVIISLIPKCGNYLLYRKYKEV